MRLIIFSMAFRSGMGRVVSELSSAASNLGVEQVLVAPPLDIEPNNATKRGVFERPTSGSGALGRIWGLVAYNLRSAIALFRAARRGDRVLMVDLYPNLPLSLAPVLAARLRGATIVLNLHDFYPHAFRYPAPLQRLERLLHRFSYRRFDGIAAMNDRQVERLVNECGISRHRICRAYLGPFQLSGIRTPASTSNAPTSFLALGSIRANKNVAESMIAIAHLRAQGLDVKLRIAGAPRREELAYWNKCLALAGEGPFEMDIRFIEEDQLPEVLSGVSALICPYSGFDSQSGVAITALSNELPLIATKAAMLPGYPGSTWVIEDDPVTSESIEAAIRSFLVESVEVRCRRAKQTTQDFLNERLWERTVRNVVELRC